MYRPSLVPFLAQLVRVSARANRPTSITSWAGPKIPATASATAVYSRIGARRVASPSASSRVSVRISSTMPVPVPAATMRDVVAPGGVVDVVPAVEQQRAEAGDDSPRPKAVAYVMVDEVIGGPAGAPESGTPA